MFRPLEISVLQWPLSIPLATQTHLPLQNTRTLTWWWPPEAETCRLIIKIPYINCNKLFNNSCLVFNLNYYKFVVLDVHTLLFSILISTTGMIHLNKNHIYTLRKETGNVVEGFVPCIDYTEWKMELWRYWVIDLWINIYLFIDVINLIVIKCSANWPYLLLLEFSAVFTVLCQTGYLMTLSSGEVIWNWMRRYDGVCWIGMIDLLSPVDYF